MSYKPLNLTEELRKLKVEELRVLEARLMQQLRAVDEKKADVEHALSVARGEIQVLHEMEEEAAQ